MLSKFVITYFTIFSHFFSFSANIAYNNSSKAVEHSQLRFIHTMPKRVRVLPRNDSDDEFADINKEAILESSRDAKRERRREQHRRSAKKVRSAKKKRAKEARDAPDTAPETADAAMEDDDSDIKEVDGVENEDPGWISSEAGGKCNNCCRHHIEDCEPCYQFRMCYISPSDLKVMRTPLFSIMVEEDDQDEEEYQKPICLCESCYFFGAKSVDEKSCRNLNRQYFPSSSELICTFVAEHPLLL